MRKLKVSVLVSFFAVLCLPWPASLIYNACVTQEEKLQVAPFPKGFGDDYFARLAQWLNDNSAFRYPLVTGFGQSQSNFENEFFGNWYALIYGNTSYNPIPEERLSYEALKADPYLDLGQPYYPARKCRDILYGKGPWLFFMGEGAFEDYTGANVLSNEEMMGCLAKIYTVEQLCAQRGISFAFSVLPDKEQVYADKMPTLEIKDRYKKMLRLRDMASLFPELHFSYPLEELVHGRIGGKETYYAQDTHWNSYGAYIGYQKTMDAIGRGGDPVDPFLTWKKGGDLAGVLGILGDVYPTEEILYKPDVTLSISDSADWYARDIVSSSGNSDHCLVIGDSFRIAWTNILGKDFATSSLVHYKAKYKDELSRRVSNLKRGDTLVFACAERYFDDLMEQMDRIAGELAGVPIL